MDRKIKEYIESGRALQQKFDELKFGKLTRREEMVEKFKPITEKLSQLRDNLKPVAATAAVVTNKGTVPPYLGEMLASGKQLDSQFGIRIGKDGLYVGNSQIDFTPANDFVLESDKSVYEGTQGLWELLTSKNPQNYDDSDLSNYEQIILRTYAYKRNNDRNSKFIKSNRSTKYNDFIRPILAKHNLLKSAKPAAVIPLKYTSDGDDDEFYDAGEYGKKGSGLRKIHTNHDVEYVHWNTIDELIERLCHLWGEVQSGNTNPLLLNEIVNIIQEFKEL